MHLVSRSQPAFFLATRDYNAPINVKSPPHPVRDGWGITRGLQNFVPRVGHLISCIFIGSVQNRIPYLSHLLGDLPFQLVSRGQTAFSVFLKGSGQLPLANRLVLLPTRLWVGVNCTKETKSLHQLGVCYQY